MSLAAKENRNDLLRLIILLSIILLFIKICFLGQLSLLPEEAYYWQFAKHLDLSYLDHPPMVAWTIYVGTKLFQISEFGVRIGAVFWWAIGAFFVYQFSKEAAGPRAGLTSVGLYSLLPYFYGIGFFITPDSPLVAFWAASLYFLYMVLMRERREFWWGVGLSFGLGLISKYPIGLLGFTTVVYMTLVPKARKYYFEWRTYAAVVATVLLFSPVLIWNFDHSFASFAFQSAGRIEKGFHFSFHELLGHVLIVLTPVGMMLFGLYLRDRFRAIRKNGKCKFTDRLNACLSDGNEGLRFISFYCLIPLGVFAAYSLFREVKINWTGSVFLAFLPVLSVSLTDCLGISKQRIRNTWLVTFAILFVVYFFSMLYLSGTLSWVPFSDRMYKVLTGKELAAKVLRVEAGVLKASGHTPVVVGMDKHYLASQLAFYRKRVSKEVETTAGRSLFGLPSLMYQYWSRPEDYLGRDMILVSRGAGDVEDVLLKPYFQSLSPVEVITTKRNNFITGHFYYRVGSGYRKPKE